MESSIKPAAIAAGRVIGALLLLQMLGSALVDFRLETPLFDPPGFLLGAGLHGRQIGIAALVGLVLEALWIGIALTLFPFVRDRARALTLWLVILSGVCLAVSVFENAGVMTMVSLSEAYDKANIADRQSFDTVRVAVAAARNWPHFLGRMLDGCTLFVLMVLFYRCALMPRAVAACGILAAILQVTGVAMPLFGRGVIFPLLAPTGLVLLVVALLLIVRGLQEPPVHNAPA